VASPSKTQVDKAGAILRDWYNSPAPNMNAAESAAAGVIWQYRQQFAYPMTKVSANLRYYVKQHNAGIVVVAQRHKRLPRIVEKLHRHPRMRMSQMQDVGGCRAIIGNQAAAYRVLEGLGRNWEIAAVDDYVSNPRPTGYRALHVITIRDGYAVEVQLRTHGQQTWADEVERLDGMTPYRLKDGDGPDDAMEYTRELAQLIADIEQGRVPDEARQRRLRSLRQAAISAL
jgi:putative GTP pyrophosphokinase